MSTTVDTLPRVLTALEAADVLRVSRSHIYELVKQGALPAVANVGGRVLVSRTAIEAFIDGRDPA